MPRPWLRRRRPPDDPATRYEHWQRAVTRAAGLTHGSITEWGTSICGYGMRMFEHEPSSKNPLDEINELKATGASILALAEELERRHTAATT